MKSTITKGFTLLEIVIAIGIFSLVGMASNAVLTRVVDINDASKQQFEALDRLQYCFMVMERDFLQMMPRSARVNGEASELVLAGDKNWLDSDSDGISFVRGGWDNPQWRFPRSSLQPVSYRLREGKLERLHANYVDNVVGFEPIIRELLVGVEDFRIEYLVAEQSIGSGGQSKITRAERYASNQLPRGITVSITTQEFGVIERTFSLTVSNP